MCRTSRVCVRMRAVKMRIRVCSEYVEGRARTRARGPRLRKIGIDRSTRKITTHTECFTCSRIFFDRLFDSCPHCGRTTARHYYSEDLNYFTQKSRVGQPLYRRSQSRLPATSCGLQTFNARIL